MSKINLVDNSLSSSSGTVNFCGNVGPSLTGNVDSSSCSKIVSPSSASPSLSVTGEIEIDTSVSGYPGLINYYSGSETLISISIDESDLDNTDKHMLSYNSGSSKMTMRAQQSASPTNNLLQFVYFTSTSDDTTTSTSLSDTSLSGSITPISSTSNIYIYCFGFAQTSINSSSSADRFATFSIRRTSGAPSDLVDVKTGRGLVSASSISASSYEGIQIRAIEASLSTSVHDYVLRFSTEDSNCITTLKGASATAQMIIMEIGV